MIGETREASAKGCIGIEIKPEKTWSKEYIQYVTVLYCATKGSEHESEYRVDILQKFIKILSTVIFESSVGMPSGCALLTKKIFPGQYPTLLEQLCFSVYKKYIQDMDNDANLLISKRDLEKLDQSPAQMVRYMRELADCTQKFLTINGTFRGENIVLELTLLFS